MSEKQSLVISWSTKKENGAFTGAVVGVGHKHFEEIQSRPGFSSRARAKTWAIKAARFHKAQKA